MEQGKGWRGEQKPVNDRAAEVLDGRAGLAGSTHLGLQADGVGWGLCNTGLSHMAPNHTKPLGNPMLASNCGPHETIGQMCLPPDPGPDVWCVFPSVSAVSAGSKPETILTLRGSIKAAIMNERHCQSVQRTLIIPDQKHKCHNFNNCMTFLLILNLRLCK